MNGAPDTGQKGPPLILAYGFAVVIPFAGLLLGAAVIGRGDRNNGIAIIAVSIVAGCIYAALLL